MSQTNPKVSNVAVNAIGGAPVLIRLSILASKVSVQEDPSLNAGVAQGLTGYYLDPDVILPTAFIAAPTLAAAIAGGLLANPNLQVWLANSVGQQGQAYQPITFGGSDGRVHGGEGGYVGAQNSGVLLLTSNSATATGVLLVEWP